MSLLHVSDGLFFRRNEDGSVTVLKTNDEREPADVSPEDSNVVFAQTMDAGSWCSVVLTMSAFSERPGDWHAWMRHHSGEEDLLVGKRGGY